MKRLTTILCVFIFSLAARAGEPVKAITVPFELIKSQHMVVQVKVNGQGPFRLIFDTGAPLILIDNKLAKAGDVIPKNFKPPFLSSLLGLPKGEFKVKSLEVGAVKAEGLNVVVMDHPTVTAIAKAVGPIHGIVGFPFFSRYRVTIDYQAKEMTFVPTKFRAPDLLKKLEKDLEAGPKKAKHEVLAPAGQWGFRVAKAAGDDAPGVTLAEVMPDSPAAAAGLKKGDRLLVLDGRWTDTATDCYAAAAQVPPGTEARLLVMRDGKEKELTVKVRTGV
jgi:hypothetical protein